jgi:hypothetical protein
MYPHDEAERASLMQWIQGGAEGLAASANDRRRGLAVAASGLVRLTRRLSNVRVAPVRREAVQASRYFTVTVFVRLLEDV